MKATLLFTQFHFVISKGNFTSYCVETLVHKKLKAIFFLKQRVLFCFFASSRVLSTNNKKFVVVLLLSKVFFLHRIKGIFPFLPTKEKKKPAAYRKKKKKMYHITKKSPYQKCQKSPYHKKKAHITHTKKNSSPYHTKKSHIAKISRI